jgi:hypothetical protein
MPGVAAEVEAALAARQTPAVPPQYADPVALASLIVAIATLAWTVYTDLRKRTTAIPAPDVINPDRARHAPRKQPGRPSGPRHRCGRHRARGDRRPGFAGPGCAARAGRRDRATGCAGRGCVALLSLAGEPACRAPRRTASAV